MPMTTGLFFMFIIIFFLSEWGVPSWHEVGSLDFTGFAGMQKMTCTPVQVAFQYAISQYLLF